MVTNINFLLTFSIDYQEKSLGELVCVIKWWRVKLGNNFTRVLSKDKDSDKMQVKLFPNFMSIPFWLPINIMGDGLC